MSTNNPPDLQPTGYALAPLLTVEEAADELRLSASGVRKFIARGDLPAIRLGRAVRIRRGDLEALIAGGAK